MALIDETWAKTNMTPLRDGIRAAVGAAKALYCHWKTMTFLAALRHDRIGAPFVFDGPNNGEVFRLYVEAQLVPRSKPAISSSSTICGSHKSKAVRNAKDYGPHKTIYNRFICWSRLGVFNRIFAELAATGPKPERLMIDATHLKAHLAAASLLEKGLFPDVSGAPKAD